MSIVKSLVLTSMRTNLTGVTLVRATKRNYIFLAKHLTAADGSVFAPRVYKVPVPQVRTFKLPAVFPQVGNKRKCYAERRLLGYSMEQMYAVVSEVDKYSQFVPYCKKSVIKSRQPGQLKADLAVGFPPLLESYTSIVKMQAPRSVSAVCTEGQIFSHMLTDWRFSPGPKPSCCWLDFSTSFEFRSMLHSHLSHIFFDQVVRQMVNAFLVEARKRYGPAAICPQPPKIIQAVS